MSANYLVKRNGTYHFRLRIPQDLVQHYSRREIQRSLKTGNLKTANTLARAYKVQLEADFALLRQRLAVQRSGRPLLPQIELTGEPMAKSKPISEVFCAYVADREQGWNPKTRQMQQTTLNQFITIIGDKPIRKVTREDCRTFKNTLAELPPKWSQRYAEQKPEEILALGLPPMTPTSVNRTTSMLSTFFKWAAQEEYVASSPAVGLRVPVNRHQDQERDIFSKDALRLLFEQSPLYLGCRSDKHRAEPGNQVFADAYYWLPLIGLYSGMRLEEIAQLHTEDVKMVEGVWVFDVRAGEGRRLKSASSERLVPVHPTLQSLGLIEYHARQAESCQPRIWPEFKRGPYGSYSFAFSKWFGRYRRAIGITDPKITFHSLRHTFIDCLKQADVPESRIAELVGHKNASITLGRYGKRYRPDGLLETLRKAKFGLSHPMPT